jgi:hypothetical protein
MRSRYRTPAQPIACRRQAVAAVGARPLQLGDGCVAATVAAAVGHGFPARGSEPAEKSARQKMVIHAHLDQLDMRIDGRSKAAECISIGAEAEIIIFELGRPIPGIGGKGVTCPPHASSIR